MSDKKNSESLQIIILTRLSKPHLMLDIWEAYAIPAILSH